MIFVHFPLMFRSKISQDSLNLHLKSFIKRKKNIILNSRFLMYFTNVSSIWYICIWIDEMLKSIRSMNVNSTSAHNAMKRKVPEMRDERLRLRVVRSPTLSHNYFNARGKCVLMSIFFFFHPRKTDRLIA